MVPSKAMLGRRKRKRGNIIFSMTLERVHNKEIGT